MFGVLIALSTAEPVMKVWEVMFSMVICRLAASVHSCERWWPLITASHMITPVM